MTGKKQTPFSLKLLFIKQKAERTVMDALRFLCPFMDRKSQLSQRKIQGLHSVYFCFGIEIYQPCCLFDSIAAIYINSPER